MRRRNSIACALAVTALVAVGGVAPAAHAQGQDGFWQRVSHPHRARALALVKNGRALVDQQNYGAAVTALEEAITLEPDLAEAHWWLGLAYSGVEKWASCADSLDRVERLDDAFQPPGGRATLDVQLGLCASLAGRLERAIVHYRRVALSVADESGPQAVMAHWNLGDCYMALGRLEQAIASYRRSVELAPQRAILHFALGVAYDRDEQVARGAEEIAQGLKLDSSVTLPSMEYYDQGRVLFVPTEDEDYYRGLAHLVAGRRLSALVHFRHYLERAPGAPWAARAREHLARLGAPHLGDTDVDAKVPTPAVRAPLVKALLGLAPALERCLAGQPSARLLIQVALPGSSARAPRGGIASPATHVVNGGPVEASAPALDCVTHLTQGLRWPARVGDVQLTFSVVAAD